MSEDTQSTAQRVRRNAEIAIKSLSSYVVVIVSAAAAVYLGFSEEQRAAFVTAHPVLMPLSPYLALIAWLAARLAPQNMVLSADKAAERARLIAYVEQLETALGIHRGATVTQATEDDAHYSATLPPAVAAAPAPVSQMPEPATVVAQFGGEPAPPADLVSGARALLRMYREAYPTLGLAELSARVERDLRMAIPP